MYLDGVFNLPPLLVNNHVDIAILRLQLLSFCLAGSWDQFNIFVHCVLGFIWEKNPRNSWLSCWQTFLSRREEKPHRKFREKATHHFPFPSDVFDPKIKVKQGNPHRKMRNSKANFITERVSVSYFLGD